ncbi:S1 family peptidase [Pseudoalteromonas luteoviolacea]|uniref:S1 family peptidase n=1 Tax=Pseudoalteromonas luteoviolacea TaxID=43657 RepID=UPI001B35FE04|nr:serine protease [Pseudoalteromonas luteoviolacea]MBQ4838547.1 trypsin-like peptidase domain-containing protein [Pseudoalteromonas luteoviolacea]
MLSGNSLKERYIESAGAVAFVAVVDKETEDNGIGTAFHIGGGLFVTAKHVVEGKVIESVATTKRAVEKINRGVHSNQTADYVSPRKLHVIDGPHFSQEDGVDVAVFKVDIGNQKLPSLRLDSLTSHDIDDNSYLLGDALIIGYPPIPFSTMPIQVASLAKVNAVVDVWHSKHPHYIVSAMARGGFSGGPVITEYGQVMGIVTESLVQNGNPTENGYMSVLCAEAVIKEIQKHYEFDLDAHGIWWESDVLYEIKLRNPKLRVNELNARSSDVVIHVYDDDRDVYGQIECEDIDLLTKAISAFDTVSPVSKIDEFSSNTLYAFSPSGSAETLKAAALSAKDIFINEGYVEVSSKESYWQLTNHE